MSTARSTPAQKPRGLARMIRRVRGEGLAKAIPTRKATTPPGRLEQCGPRREHVSSSYWRDLHIATIFRLRHHFGVPFRANVCFCAEGATSTYAYAALVRHTL